MKKLVLAAASALALLGVAACSDSADTTTTQGVPQNSTTEPATPAEPSTPPATDNTTTQSTNPAPETGTGGEMQNSEPAPVEPAPAQ